MLELVIIFILAVLLMPVFLVTLPFIVQPVGWPELPPQEEHYISPPRVIFEQPVHPMFTREGNTEMTCLCDACYTVFMITQEIEKEAARSRRQPPRIPVAALIIKLPKVKKPSAPPPIPNPYGFDFSDIEVNSPCSHAKLEFSSALSVMPDVANGMANMKLQAATEQQHGTSLSRWEGLSRPAPS